MFATPRVRTLADATIPGSGLLRDVGLVCGFALFVAVFAQIAVRLPFTTVPITGQTLGVLLAGGALGARKGAASMGLYALLGTIGLPVFAPASGSLGDTSLHFIFPWIGTAAPLWAITSGGYIIGFIIAAGLVGTLAERGWDRGWKVSLALLAGSVAIYLPGLAWLGFAIATSFLDATLGFSLAEVIPGSTILDKTLIGGLYPFIPGDLLKLLVAANALPGAWALIDQRKSVREVQ